MAPRLSSTGDNLSYGRLSPVERRLSGPAASLRLRLSVLLFTLRGGVSGDGRWGRSVGRSAAGMYMGDFGGRSCRVGWGKLGNMNEECGDAGDRLLSAPTPGSTGENGWFPWELGGVVYANEADEAGKLVAIFAREKS